MRVYSVLEGGERGETIEYIIRNRDLSTAAIESAIIMLACIRS
jgi:hypothetical protein